MPHVTVKLSVSKRREPWFKAALPMLRCFSTLGCPDLSLDAALALAHHHRLDAIELRALGGSVDLPAYFAANFGTPAALAAHVRERAPGVRVIALDTSLQLATGGTAGIGPMGHMGPLGPMKGAPEQDRQREAFLAFVPWAEALGVRWLRVFDGKGTAPPEAAIAEAAGTVCWWREQRAAHGWQTDIVVETHDTLFTPAAIARFLALAPGSAILWDAHHTWRKAGEDPVATWRAIRPHVAHVHVKDSIPVPSARHPFTYTLPGDGGFPIAPLLAALRADDFSGGVSLEWEKLWHPYLPPLDEALTAAATRHWW